MSYCLAWLCKRRLRALSKSGAGSLVAGWQGQSRDRRTATAAAGVWRVWSWCWDDAVLPSTALLFKGSSAVRRLFYNKARTWQKEIHNFWIALLVNLIVAKANNIYIVLSLLSGKYYTIEQHFGAWINACISQDRWLLKQESKESIWQCTVSASVYLFLVPSIFHVIKHFIVYKFIDFHDQRDSHKRAVVSKSQTSFLWRHVQRARSWWGSLSTSTIQDGGRREHKTWVSELERFGIV